MPVFLCLEHVPVIMAIAAEHQEQNHDDEEQREEIASARKSTVRIAVVSPPAHINNSTMIKTSSIGMTPQSMYLPRAIELTGRANGWQ